MTGEYQNKFNRIYERGRQFSEKRQIPFQLICDIFDQLLDSFEQLPDAKNHLQDLKSSQSIQAVLFARDQQITLLQYEEVFSLITHEFKNLLTTIQGYHRMLQKEMNGSRYDALDAAERNTQKLFRMVEGLLKMSMSDQKTLEPHYKLLNFENDVLDPVIAELNESLNMKKMTLSQHSDTEKSILMGDESLLEIAMRNLLENAVKYGDANSTIDLTIHRQNSVLTVNLRNQCRDISSDIRDKIFDKFFTAAVKNASGGTGIGLYNVKNIIELHGGQISCHIGAGEWIEFHFDLPLNLE